MWDVLELCELRGLVGAVRAKGAVGVTVLLLAIFIVLCDVLLQVQKHNHNSFIVFVMLDLLNSPQKTGQAESGAAGALGRENWSDPNEAGCKQQ